MRRKAKLKRWRANCKFGCCVDQGRWKKYYSQVRLKNPPRQLAGADLADA